MSDDPQASIEDAIDRFVHGAKTLQAGYYLDQNPICRKGIEIIRKAVKALDDVSPSGRDPLLRLLDDPHEIVRTVAAAGLWQSHTDRARKVIEHVDKYGITEAHMLAYKILRYHGRYNPVASDPRYQGLHEDEDGIDRWHDPEFRERAFWGQLPSTFARKPDAALLRQGGEQT